MLWGGASVLENLTIEMSFDLLVGRASRIRERVVDTGSLDTEMCSEAFGTKAVTEGSGNPVLQNGGTAFES